MARTPCTHYNPSLGVKYVVVDVSTGEEVTVRVLSPKDKDHAPIRSHRACERGEEYFKVVFPDGSVRKVMNSLKRDRVLTDDGKYEFVGKRPNGEALPRSTDKAAVAGEVSAETQAEAESVATLDEVAAGESDFDNAEALTALEG